MHTKRLLTQHRILQESVSQMSATWSRRKRRPKKKESSVCAVKFYWIVTIAGCWIVVTGSDYDHGLRSATVWHCLIVVRGPRQLIKCQWTPALSLSSIALNGLGRDVTPIDAPFSSPVHTSNNVEATFDFVEATFDIVAFDNVASSLLLVWTGLYCENRRILSWHDRMSDADRRLVEIWASDSYRRAPLCRIYRLLAHFTQ